MDTIYKILKHYMAEIKDFNSSDLFRAVSIMMQVDIYIWTIINIALPSLNPVMLLNSITLS